MSEPRIPQANNLDLIRTLLALGVLTFHTLLTADIRIPQFPWVPAFIAISGFLITDSMGRSEGYAHFGSKRLLRVGPGFLVSLGLVLALGGDVTGTLQNWATMGLVVAGSNLPIWSLGIEELLYFLLAVWFALGLYATRRRALVFLALLFVVLATLSFFAHGQVFLLLRVALAFVCGSAAYLLRDRIRWSPWAGAACLAVACWLRNRVDIHSWQQILLTGPALAYGLVALGIYARPIFARYKQTVGDPSYGLYLYHWPIMYFFYDRGITDIWLTPITLAATACLALLSWHVLEKRALAFRTWRPGRTGHEAPPRTLPRQYP